MNPRLQGSQIPLVVRNLEALECRQLRLNRLPWYLKYEILDDRKPFKFLHTKVFFTPMLLGHFLYHRPQIGGNPFQDVVVNRISVFAGTQIRRTFVQNFVQRRFGFIICFRFNFDISGFRINTIKLTKTLHL